jgi:hypothetical protein
MRATPRLRHDPDDERHLLYCSHPGCWEKRPQFRLGRRMLVDLELVTSEHMMVLTPDGMRQAFEKGHVESLECSNCGETYFPDSAYEPL